RLRISNNRFTGTALRVVSYDVKGAGYDRKFDEIDRVNGRFHNATKEEKKSISMTVRYDVEKIAYASHLKANIQAMLRGHFYLRELAASESEIKFENIFEPKEQSFELEYVETIELPYFESIGYSTDLEKESGNLNKWGIPDKNPFNTSHKERRYTLNTKDITCKEVA
ncbi:MAG: phage tail protein, partial [Staphylococcus epidermidis]|nr:phage tail protein [Staphylococcus epidermidis]